MTNFLAGDRHRDRARAGIILLLCLLLPGCAAGRSDQAPLTVFAAASLSDAFTEIGRQFEARHPEQPVRFTFAGSQQLAQQVLQGAQGDIFASADERQMALVQDSGLAAGAATALAANRLAVAMPAGNPAQITELSDLARPGLRIVLADPAVPAGRYTAAFLQRAALAPAFPAGYAASVQANVVSYEQSVRAVFTKIELGEADAGIVYRSDLNGTDLAVLPIPDALNVVATYPIAVLKDSAQPAVAQAFIDFVLGSAGQAVLREHGFESP